MKCNKCGYILPGDSEFCQYCGVKLEDASINERNTDDNANAVCEEKSENNNDITFCEGSDIEIDKEIHANGHEEVQTETIMQETLTPDVAVQTGSKTEEQEEESVEKNITEKTDIVHREISREDADIITPPLNKKIRYCKMCGGLIDSETKKCTSCGKQFFKFSKGIIKMIIPIMLLVILIGLNVFQYVQLEKYKDTISSQSKTIAEQKEKISGKRNSCNNKISKSQFMSKYIVIIGSTNNKYHKYGCKNLDTSRFWAYNINTAKLLGYSACSKCN